MKRTITLGVLIVSALAVPAMASAATIYSSLPLSGASAAQTRAINDGARQALQEAGGMAGGQAITSSVAKRMTITVSTLAPDAYGPAGAAIIGSGDPYKLYGYEAMKLILDGVNAAGAGKPALLGYLRSGVQNRASVLGTYSLDANGDTTNRAYGLYGVSGKALVWKGAITAA